MDKKNEYGLRALHEYELMMLLDIIKVLDVLKIKYYGIAGTCLGAVRHNGFIPWDDDIDLGVERQDFDILVEKLQNEIGQQYTVQQYRIDHTFDDIVLKVFDNRISIVDESTNVPQETHAWIDIFPIDKMPDNPIMKELHYVQMMFWRAVVAASLINSKVDIHRKRNPIVLLVLKIMLSLHTEKKIDSYKSMCCLDKVMKKYCDKNYRTRINFLGAYRKREIFDTEIFGDGKKIDFDGVEITVPQKPIEYLDQMYGDWQSFPKAEERNHHHSKVVMK